MKRTVIINILTILFYIPTIVKGQTDSIEIYKISDTYIEIKTLRYVLDTGYPTGAGSWTKESLIPKPINLKNGTVLIKDRLNRPLALYIYSDSINVIQEHYLNGQLEWQRLKNKDNSLLFEKWYWPNGKIHRIEYFGNGKNEFYKYSEDGQLIKDK